MKKIIVLLIGLIYSYSAFADVSSKLLALKTTLNPFIVKSKKDSKRSRRSFASFDPNDVKPSSSYKDSESAKELLAFMSDKGVNLDLDNNGVDDYWRTYTRGRVSSVKIDMDNDGFYEEKESFYSNGLRKKRYKAIKVKNKYDYIEKCDSTGKNCTELFLKKNKKFKKIVKKKLKTRIKVSIYSYAKNKQVFEQSYYQPYSSSLEGAFSNCESCKKNGNGDGLKGIINALNDSSVMEKPKYREVNKNKYEELPFGMLVNTNCYSDGSRDSLVAKIKDALLKTLSCFNDKAELLKKKGFEEHSQNIYNNLMAKLANRLSGLNGGFPKISCSPIYGTDINPDLKGATMATLHRGVSDKVYGPDGNLIEAFNDPTIIVPSRESLSNNSSLTGEFTNTFTNALSHELVHLITGVPHGAVELADSCSNMCGSTRFSGLDTSDGSSTENFELKAAKICGTDSESDSPEYLEYNNKTGIEAVIDYVEDSQYVISNSNMSGSESWLIMYWKRNYSELKKIDLKNKEIYETLVEPFIGRASKKKSRFMISEEYIDKSRNAFFDRLDKKKYLGKLDSSHGTDHFLTNFLFAPSEEKFFDDVASLGFEDAWKTELFRKLSIFSFGSRASTSRPRR